MTSQEPAQQPEILIAELPLLARLSKDDRQALASRARMRSYPAATVIFREGEPGDSLHVIVSGRVRIVVSSGSGEEATVAVLGVGDCFGELSLLDGLPRSASAVTSIATRTFVVTRDAFVEWLTDRPSAGLAIMETLSLRLRRTDQALADMAFLDLNRRLAKQLVQLAEVQDLEGARSNQRIRVQVTQSELASMLGVSRESVNKQVNAFARDGLVSLSRGAVTVEDLGSLRRQA
jgi:CRP-like cAMP-binding protein